VQEIKWSERAFESLVLPEDQKDLILALTESQRANREAFDDVIQGKGTSSPFTAFLFQSNNLQVWA